jgi:excisionase family DNA binding protein
MPFRRFQRNRGTSQVEIKPQVAAPEQVAVESLSYSAKEAATLLGIGMQTIYRYLERGDIPSVRVGGKILIPRTAPIFQTLRDGKGSVNAINTP